MGSEIPGLVMGGFQKDQQGDSRDLKRALGYVRNMALITIGIVIPFFLSFLFLREWILSGIALMGMILFLLTFFLIKKGKRHLPRLLYSLTTILVILSFDMALGGAARIHLFLFPTAMASFYLFTSGEQGFRNTYFVLCGLGFLFHETNPWPYYETIPLVPGSISKHYDWATKLMVFVALWAVQRTFWQENEKVEKEREESIRERDNILRENDRTRENYRQALRMASIGSYIVYMETEKLEASREFQELFGLTENDQTLDHLISRIPEEERGEIEEAIRGLGPGDKPLSFQHRFYSEKGETFHVLSSFRKEREREGSPILHGLMRDITYETHQQRLLNSKLMGMEGETRYSAAHELTEEVNQNLSAAKMHLERIQEISREKEDPRIEDTSAQLDRLLATTINRTKRIGETLNPSTLRDIGLESALRDLIDDRNSMNSATEFVFHPPEASPALPLLPRIILFQALKEILEIAEEKGNAKRVTTEMSHKEDDAEIRIGVRDDSPHPLFWDREGGSSHQKILQTRVEALHGDFEVYFQPDRGNSIHITVNKGSIQSLQEDPTQGEA